MWLILSSCKKHLLLHTAWHLPSSCNTWHRFDPVRSTVVLTLARGYKQNNTCTAVPVRKGTVLTSGGIPSRLPSLFFSLFSHPIYCFRAPFLSPSIVTQIRGGHIAGSSPPSPLRFVPSTLIARRLLPSSTRIELCPPTLGTQQLILF